MAIGMGDPPRKIIKRYLRWFCTQRPPVDYLALYHVNVASERKRKASIARVRRAMERMGG